VIGRSTLFSFRRALALIAFAALVGGCSSKQPLPELGAVPHFAGTDQNGKPLSEATLRGNVWAAAFIFTRCPTACPRVTRAMRGVLEDAARRGVPLKLVSFSVDPDNDTPEVLRGYANEYHADSATWSFVTGDANAVKTTAEQGFKIALEGVADPAKADFGIIHGTQLVLVDRDLKIRGYYASADEKALSGLVTDAARLANGS
jgi:protein SCO1/2